MAGRGDVYGGVCGQTRTDLIHYSCPCGVMFTAHAYRSVNGTNDPALGNKLIEGTLQTIACPACGKSSTAQIAVIYHDEDNRLLVLVLPDALRHRELDERAELLHLLAKERGQPVPRYASDFATVFGGAGLLKLLEARAASEVSAADLATRLQKAAERDLQLTEREEKLAAQAAELGRLTADADRRAAELRQADRHDRGAELSGPVLSSTPSPSRGAGGGQDDGSETGPFERLEESPTPAPFVAPALRSSSTHDSSATRVAPPPGRDVAVERWVVSKQPTLVLVDQGRVRLLATVGPERIEAFVTGTLQPRIQLHRVAPYPLIVLSVVSVGEGSADTEPLWFPLDTQRHDDRGALGALTHDFHLVLEIYDKEYLPVVQHDLAAPLGENVAQVITAAEGHLSSLPAGQRSFEGALLLWRGNTFDRLGRRAHNLEQDSFALLPTAATTRMALNIVAYWTEPENEDYLIFSRSFPLPWWRAIQERVVQKAIDFGIAMPSSLAQLAIRAGMARSRKDLAHKLVHAFGDVAAGLKPNELEPADMLENWRTLVSECEALGVALEGKAGDLAAIAVGAMPASPLPTRPQRAPTGVPGSPASPQHAGAAQPAAAQAQRATNRAGRNATPVIAGEIASPQRPASVPTSSSDSSGEPAGGELRRRDLKAVEARELITLLDDKDLRRDAALELCRRAEPSGVGPVFGALRRMTRGEAVRVMPALVAFGDRSTPHLIDGLRSRKGFVRHGCALALGVLKAADGIEPLCDLLFAEPTDVWREVARAIGEVGSGAVMSLAARLRDQPADRRERIAWALAHVTARGGRSHVETLAQGRDVIVAAAAQRALELAKEARSNDAEVRGSGTPRDQTVNRAFSRRFFEAMSGRAPLSAATATELRGGHGGDELELADAELLEEDEEQLDDDDLLPG